MTDITAAMIERACKAYHLGIYSYPCLITDMQRKGMEAAIREVLHLVEEAQTADTDKIEELEWEGLPCGDYMAPNSRGYYLIVDWNGCWDIWVLSFCDSEKDREITIIKTRDLEAAKSAAESHWRDILLDSVLEEV